MQLAQTIHAAGQSAQLPGAAAAAPPTTAIALAAPVDELLALAGRLADAGVLFAVGLLGFATHLAWQVTRLDVNRPDVCLMLFKSNRDAGLLLFAALLIEAAF